MILLDSFPRQIAYPFRKTCLTEKEFYTKFNNANGLKNKIYFSVLGCDKEGDFSKTIINKIPFDLDSAESLTGIRKLNKVCEALDLKRTFIFSTGGFWAFICAKNGEHLKHPKNALKNAQLHLALDKCNFSIYNKNEKGIIDPYLNDIDYHIIGDISRVARLPGSYDTKRKLFCISISLFDINKGMEHIKAKATKQSFDLYVYGNKFLDMKQFDTAPPSIESIDLPEGNYSYKRTGMPPCVWQWITESSMATYRARFLATVWLKEKGWPKSLINKTVQEYWAKHLRTDGLSSNYEHWQKTQVLKLVFRNDYVFPKCETLYCEGLCNGKCKYFGGANLYDI